jgi:hypothetical protein
MNFSVEEALRLGMAKQSGRESMYGDIQQMDEQIVSGQQLLQLAEDRANNTQRRMNVNILRDLGKSRSSKNLYALADPDDDVRFFPSMGALGGKLREIDGVDNKIFWPQDGMGPLRNKSVQNAIAQGRIQGTPIQAPYDRGTTNVYNIPGNNNEPSGFKLLKISTMKEIAKKRIQGFNNNELSGNKLLKISTKASSAENALAAMNALAEAEAKADSNLTQLLGLNDSLDDDDNDSLDEDDDNSLDDLF